MGFRFYALMSDETRSKLNHLRTQLKQEARARFEAERNAALAQKQAAKLARRLEQARTQGWAVQPKPKPQHGGRFIKGAAFSAADLDKLEREMLAA